MNSPIYSLPFLSAHSSDIVGVPYQQLFNSTLKCTTEDAITLSISDNDKSSVEYREIQHTGIALSLSERQEKNLQCILKHITRSCQSGYQQEIQPVKECHQSSTQISLTRSILDLQPSSLKTLKLVGIGQTCTYSYHLTWALPGDSATVLLSSISKHPILPMQRLLRSGFRTACYAITQHLSKFTKSPLS